MFFNSLKYVLPCGACRKNYNRILKEILPLKKSVFRNRETFMLHNQVQRDIKSNDIREDFMSTARFYEQLRAKCTKDSYGCTVPLKGARKRSNITISVLIV